MGCYLKTFGHEVRGTGCTHDCWYHGAGMHHPLTTHLSLHAAHDELGLRTHDVHVGRGALLKAGDEATIKYTGTLDNGFKFDSGEYVFNFRRNQVIAGDDIGLQGMRVGGVRKLTIPASLGYGSQGYPPTIPGGATLHFRVQLVSIGHRKLSSGYKKE